MCLFLSLNKCFWRTKSAFTLTQSQLLSVHLYPLLVGFGWSCLVLVGLVWFGLVLVGLVWFVLVLFLFLSDPGVPGPIYGSSCLSLSIPLCKLN